MQDSHNSHTESVKPQSQSAKKSESAWAWAGRLKLLILLLLLPNVTWAAGDGIVRILQWIFTQLTSTWATLAVGCAVAWFGYKIMVGKSDVTGGARVAFGAGIIVGASHIANQLVG